MRGWRGAAAGVAIAAGAGTAAAQQGGVRPTAAALRSTVILEHGEVQDAGQQQTVSREEYQRQLGLARDLLAACRSDGKACDPQRVAGDETVDAPGAMAVQVHWEWLREALSKVPEAKADERARLFNEAGQRLDQDAADVAAGSSGFAAAARLPEAQRKAQRILAGRAFRHVEQSSWLALKAAAVMAILGRVFAGATDLLPQSSTLGVLLQWGILALAAVGLGLWAWRTTRQQRVVIAAEAAPAAKWQVESERWAERAQAEAERGDWREAVHSLYWAAIVMLEGQRLWRENRTRTPREYVRLLEPGSARARLLDGLTGVFERIWYGLRPADRADYESARGLYEQLRSA